MKLVVISTIRNESDILETFVRYHLRFVDRMIIVNHRSVDSSFSILESLQKEGLPLDLMEEGRLEHRQGPLLTRIMQKAVKDYDADWVLPLDADEFISTDGAERVREVIAKLPQDRIVKVPWRTYVPLPSDDSQEPNILMRVQHRRSAENPNHGKIMIPRSMAMKKRGMIAPGNHGLTRTVFGKPKDFPTVNTDELFLAHFPVRSASQIMTKAFVGWLACLSKPDREPTEAFHLKALYDRFKNGKQLRPEDIASLAMGYATPEGYVVPAHEDLVRLPLGLDARHFTLHYTDLSKANPISVLAQLAEEYAEALASVTKNELRGKAMGGYLLKSMLRFWLK